LNVVLIVHEHEYALSLLSFKMLNIMTIRVSKMTSHCTGTVQTREESESGIRK